MGRLTTHVLDTMSGTPAAGLQIELWQLDGGAAPLKTVTTNDDGRVDGPILEGDSFRAGQYELRFHAGDYLRRCEIDLPDPGISRHCSDPFRYRRFHC